MKLACRRCKNAVQPPGQEGSVDGEAAEKNRTENTRSWSISRTANQPHPLPSANVCTIQKIQQAISAKIAATANSPTRSKNVSRAPKKLSLSPFAVRSTMGRYRTDHTIRSLRSLIEGGGRLFSLGANPFHESRKLKCQKY